MFLTGSFVLLGMKDFPIHAADMMARAGAAMAARPRLTRWLLAGPGALAVAVLFTMSMPLWLPAGSAGVNGIALAVILAPLIWAVVFVYAVAADHLVRAVAVMGAVGAGTGILVLFALTGII